MSDTVLLILKHLDDVEPARAVVAALPERKFALLFANEDLRTRFGETRHTTSTDQFEYVLNVERIALAVCFAGARELSATSNFLLLSYFDELGIATLELQRDLLRDPVAAERESTARHYLGWSGSGGTGYLKLPAEPPETPLVRDDVVLVSSQLATSTYSEEQRYQFTFALLRLAREYPQLCFLWRASAAEEQSAEAKLVLAMLGSTAPSNVWLEDVEPVHAVLARSTAVITMAQTALLDYAAARKPAIVYVNDEADAQLSELSLMRFKTPDELLAAFGALRAEPANFVIDSRVPSFSPEALRARIERVEAERSLKTERREPMLRYLAYMQDARARADVGRLSPQLNALDKRLAELEKPISVLREQAESLKLRERKGGKRPLTVTQKAWKIAREVKKRAFK
jgi:hypothetical protein